MAIYQSPPGSAGNDGAIPTVYDPQWPRYTNLTDAQILAFQSFPQDLRFYTQVRAALALNSGTTVAGVPVGTLDVEQARLGLMVQAFDKGVVTGYALQDNVGNWHNLNNAQAQGLYNAVYAFLNQIRLTAIGLINGINATPATITTRKQIDQAIGAVAPNSPSATNPSAT